MHRPSSVRSLAAVAVITVNIWGICWPLCSSCRAPTPTRSGRLMAEHFYKLRVAEIVPETEDANSVRFELPEGLKEIFRFRAGQHLSVRAVIGGEEVRRNYSLCVAPDEGQLKVTVKRIAGGVFSNWVGDNLKVGDTLDVMTPHGSFTVDFDSTNKRRYVAFAGGS